MQWCPVRWSSLLVLERLPKHLLEAVPFKLPGRSATHLGSLAYALAVLSALYDILRPSVYDFSILLPTLPWRIYGKAPEPHTNFWTTILGSPKMRRQALSHLNLILPKILKKISKISYRWICELVLTQNVYLAYSFPVEWTHTLHQVTVWTALELVSGNAVRQLRKLTSWMFLSLSQ